MPPWPQIDGIVGAGALAGTHLRLDYLGTTTDRMIAACEPGSTRDQCWAAPSCAGASAEGQICFGLTAGGDTKVCP